MRLTNGSRFLAALLLIAPSFLNATPLYNTTGLFLFSGSAEEQAFAELGGDITGVGTSVVTTGIGICDPLFPNPFIPDCPPNTISFEGVTGDGNIPSGTFNMGTVTYFNGDITSNTGFITELILDVFAVNCDTELGCDSASEKSGSTLLSFVYTSNSTADIIGSSDSFCIVTVLGTGPELCAWIPEFLTASFDVIAEFGSLNIVDIIPVGPGGFVTEGRDPKMNLVHAAVPTPATLALFGLGLAGLGWLRRKKA